MVLICDANILIDLDIAGLTGPAFGLFRCAVPDLLFYEELAARHGHLLASGLELKELDSVRVIRLTALVLRHPRPGRIDLATLALAEAEGCPLLTGDASLRAAALLENVQVHGTLWLVEQLVKVGGLTLAGAIGAYERMRQAGRRLPWTEIEKQLSQFAADLQGVDSEESNSSER